MNQEHGHLLHAAVEGAHPSVVQGAHGALQHHRVRDYVEGAARVHLRDADHRRPQWILHSPRNQLVISLYGNTPRF